MFYHVPVYINIKGCTIRYYVYVFSVSSHLHMISHYSKSFFNVAKILLLFVSFRM